MSDLHKDETPHFFGATHVGQKRSSNQDNYLIADMRRLLKVCDSSVEDLDGQYVVSSGPGELLIVADGMGGHAHGQYASQAAIRLMTSHVASLMPRFVDLDTSNDLDFLAALKDGPIQIHNHFQKLGEDDPAKSQMGTTLTAACIVWPYLYVIHVGDSRCYLFRNGELRQLTTDHTVAQYLADTGGNTTDWTPNAGLQNMLWNCVSAAPKRPEPEVRREMLQLGDLVLLCSDGLTKHMSLLDITTVLASSESAEFKTHHLIDECNRRGGRDNIAIVIGSFDSPQNATALCDQSEVFKSAEDLSDTDVEISIPQ